MKKLTAFIFILLTFTFCQGLSGTKAFAQAVTQIKQTPATPPLSVNMVPGTYQGLVPCADCIGIRMELQLENVGAAKRSYYLKQTYMDKEKEERTLESRGSWSVVKGNSQDPNAVILQLLPSGEYAPLYFVKTSESEIRLLDRDQNEVKGKLNATLKRQ
jgi:hypothetical protein